jgi:ADP-heptose:LPS heptosyltransferase
VPHALGAPPDGDFLDEMVVDDQAGRVPLERILADRKVSRTDPLVCININASPLDYKRRWPLAHYAALIERILSECRGFRIVLIGSRDEAPYVAELMRALPPSRHLVNLCGVIGLEQLVQLLQRSQLFIGNDSGPLHLAAAAGIATVSFFGPETPALYGPEGGAHTVLYKGIACSPCLNVFTSKDNSSCRNNVCMKSISVDEAWIAVRERLADAADMWSPTGVGSAG